MMAGCSAQKMTKILFRDNALLRHLIIPKYRHICWSRSPQQPRNNVEFGLFFDIDGVLVRGSKVLPGTKETFKIITNGDSQFCVPTVFVTNAGNHLRQNKADQLSKWLNCKVAAKQVVMSHSPLKLFRQFWDKHVLVSGQGPVEDIAKHLGFTKVTTIGQLRNAFPSLDKVDHRRRRTAPCAFEKYFPKIEAVLLFGEPVRWETNLQLIIDVLLTNGRPSEAPAHIIYPHIPVLACNMDLMWMSDAAMPRFAHGCFLHCLESLYHKISGYELKYTALVGKPSEITYHHSEHMLQLQARALGLPTVKRMYCIGDNPDADIYGANLYHKYIQSKLRKIEAKKMMAVQGGSGSVPQVPEEECLIHRADSRTYAIEEKDKDHVGVEECHSILVSTGVFNESRDYRDKVSLLNHNHRDFLLDNDLKEPCLKVPNVFEAVQSVFKREGLLS